MAENFLQLYQDKTEVLVIGPKAKREKHLSKLHELSLKTFDQVKNLHVIFDSELSFNPHVKYVVKTDFYHLNITRVHQFLFRGNSETLMYAFISSHIDYCNELQNSAARVLMRTRSHVHIKPVLKSLHLGSTLRYF